MRRLCILCLLASAIAPASSVAGSSARTPTTECSWSSNGQEVVIDGYRYICTCERAAAINEIWCTLINLGPVTDETRKRATRIAKAKVKKVSVKLIVVKPAVVR